MKPISQIKKDLAYTEDLADIINALKLMASAEFNSLSARMEAKDIVREEVISCFHLLTKITEETHYFTENEELPKGYLLVCSDEGFLGEVNNAIADIALRRGMSHKARYIVLGERGGRILKESGVKYTGSTNDFKAPACITADAVCKAMKESDRMQRPGYTSIVEKCFINCPAGR